MPEEIIVVDNNSIDETKQVAKKYANKVFNLGPERSAQRNFGAKNAKGQYLFFLDADMRLSRNVIRECVLVMLNGGKIGAIAVPEKPIAGSFWEKVKAFEREIYNADGDEATDAARFFTREAFLTAGGYDETITGPEDWDLPDSIKEKGYKIERIKSKIYHYERVPDPIKLAKKKFYYGLKSHRYFQKHKISPIGVKTVYFLRPVFYKNWKKLLLHPLMTLGMIVMLSFEQVGGGLGYLIGKYKKL